MMEVKEITKMRDGFQEIVDLLNELIILESIEVNLENAKLIDRKMDLILYKMIALSKRIGGYR